jgi:hypothetical protein
LLYSISQVIASERFLSVLFPFGPEAIRFDLHTNIFGETYFTHQGANTKKCGVAIPTTFLNCGESRGIESSIGWRTEM